jgi:DDE domain
VNVNGVWRYVYRAIDEHGQVIDVLLSSRRDAAAPAGYPRWRCGHIDGVSTPVLYTFGRNQPKDPNTHASIAHPGTIGQTRRHRITFRVRGTKFDSAAVATINMLVL